MKQSESIVLEDGAYIIVKGPNLLEGRKDTMCKVFLNIYNLATYWFEASGITT